VDGALPTRRLPERATDLAMALGVGALVSLSPLTASPFGAHARASLAAGLGAAVLAYAARRAGWLPRLSPEPCRREGARPTLAAGLATVLVVLAFLPTLAWLFERWTTSVWQNVHGLFIPLVMFWLTRRTLQAAPVERFASSAWAWPVLGAAGLLLALGSVRGTPIVAALGLVLALPGLVLLLLGSAGVRRLWLPLALAPFALPVGYDSPVHDALRSACAWAVAEVLRALGVHVARIGLQLHLPHGVFEITEACSGFSTLYGVGAFALVLAYLARGTARRRLTLAAALPLAFAANVLRVLGLIALEWIQPGFFETPLHKGTGVATFLVAFFALAAVAGLLARAPRPPDRTSAPC